MTQTHLLRFSLSLGEPILLDDREFWNVGTPPYRQLISRLHYQFEPIAQSRHPLSDHGGVQLAVPDGFRYADPPAAGLEIYRTVEIQGVPIQFVQYS